MVESSLAEQVLDVLLKIAHDLLLISDEVVTNLSIIKNNDWRAFANSHEEILNSLDINYFIQD